MHSSFRLWHSADSATNTRDYSLSRLKVASDVGRYVRNAALWQTKTIGVEAMRSSGFEGELEGH